MKITVSKTADMDIWLMVDVNDLDNFDKLPDGDYLVDLKPPRSIPFHKRSMALLREMHSMIDTDLTFDPWRRLLTVKAGYFTSVGKVDVQGTTSVAVIPDSLAFEHMKDEEFKKCWRALHQAFSDKYGDQLTWDQISQWLAM